MLRDALERLRACPPALEWVWCRTDPTKAWSECPDGAWLAWIVVRTARTDAERREALGVVCAVVRELAPPRDPASERAISLAEAWCRGESVTRRDLCAAADAAEAATAHSYVAYSADAAVTADENVYAAEAAADSAAAASAAADSAAAASAAAYTDAGSACAIRRRLPSPPAWVLSACEVTA